MEDASVRITILGSGTSVGVPVLGCQCKVCQSSDPKNFRTRASIMIEDQKGARIVVDTGPEFRQQMLREKVGDLENVLYTHVHSDHSNGFDDLRGYFFTHAKPINCYMVQDEIENFKDRFSYVFRKTGYLGSKPEIILHPIPEDGVFKIANIEIEAARLPHGNVNTSCFRIGRVLYATDFKTFPEDLINRWRGRIDTMIASAPRYLPLPTHSSIPETIKVFEKLNVKRGILTHLSHEVDHANDLGKLPNGVEFAYDGLRIEF